MGKSQIETGDRFRHFAQISNYFLNCTYFENYTVSQKKSASCSFDKQVLILKKWT